MPYKDPVERAAYMAAYKKRYVAQNKEKVKVARVAYQKTEAYKRSRKKYADKNSDKWRGYSKKWRLAHPEYFAENVETRKRYLRDYRAKNREALKLKRQAKREANPGHYALIDRRHHEKYKERKNRQSREYQKGHPDEMSANKRNRRATIRGTGGYHTGEDIKAIWERQKHRCATPRCKHPISDKGQHKYHVDHVMPISRGGSNGRENLQILCATCNMRKNAKHPDEWAKENGLLFI